MKRKRKNKKGKWLFVLLAAVVTFKTGSQYRQQEQYEYGQEEYEQGEYEQGSYNQEEQGQQSADLSYLCKLEYEGEPYVVINDNIPYFNEEDYVTEAFEEYSQLDELGRCRTAYANICQEIMPTQEREAIGQIRPSGWHTVKYNGIVDGNYLYNRCHLIAFELAGENANELNLITGTRYMNVQGMLPFENSVAAYVKKTGNHVLYRVTPVFEGDNLVASGVLMEAYSVEDSGEGICFNVYVFNCQPGIVIDYATGESSLEQKETERQ